MTTVAVVGVGAIGGFAAAQVARAGHDLVLCSRRPFDRLVVESRRGTTVVDQAAVTHPSAVGDVDWVLLATKAHQNGAARTWLEGLCGPRTRAVVVLQNGIEGGAPVAGSTRGVPLVPSVVLFAAESLEPGHVRHHGASELVVPTRWAEDVAELFVGAHLVVTGAEDFVTEAWRKLVMNVMSGPVCALTRRRLEVVHDPGVAGLVVAVARECVAVARSHGAALDHDVPEELLGVLQAQPPTMGGSMLYDRLAGRATEHDAITGAVVRAGEAAGVPTPLTRAIHALLDAGA